MFAQLHVLLHKYKYPLLSTRKKNIVVSMNTIKLYEGLEVHLYSFLIWSLSEDELPGSQRCPGNTKLDGQYSCSDNLDRNIYYVINTTNVMYISLPLALY
jgi:hypothetical protein